MKKRIIPIVVLVAVGAAVAAYTLRRNNQPTDRIRFSGNIELTEVNVAFKIPGRIAELTVREGDAVRAGQVLARLDREQLLRQREREQATLASAQTLLAQATTALEWSRQSQASDLEQRRADLAAAEARLRELETGARPQEILDARSAVENARAERDRARNDWDRAQVLYKQDDISTSQYDQFRTRHDSAEAVLKQAEQRYALVQEGPRKEVIEAARAQVARARAAVRWSDAQRLEVTRREQELATRRAEIDRARAQVALIDSQLEDTVAVTPVAGVVLVKSADLGEVIAPGTTIATIGDLARPWVRGYIGERDLGRVKLGSKVKVTTDSYPGKDYWGRVSFISSEAEFTPKQIQTQEERVKLVYRIKVDIDNPHQELKSNMPVDAEILLNAQ